MLTRWCGRRQQPPLEIMASVLRTALQGWCTSCRFGAEVGACRLRGEAGGDAQQHCLRCVVASALGARLLAVTDAPVAEAAIVGALQALGRGGHEEMRVAMWVNPPHAPHAARGAMATGSTGVVRRHSSTWAALLDVPAVVPRETESRLCGSVSVVAMLRMPEVAGQSAAT